MKNLLPRLRRFIVRGIIGTFVVSVVLILSQPLQVFPGVFSVSSQNGKPLPKGVESIFVKTADGKQLEVWRLAPPSPRGVAVVFHGNAGNVENFFPYQQWAASNHLITYGFDYRGFGRSSGFPSEVGLYADTDAVYRYVIEREQVLPGTIVPVGISIGTGPAAYAAAKHSARTVVLFTPYTSLPDVARTLPVFGLLSSFLWYEFPVLSYLSSLKESCMVIAHGKLDEVIPFSHSVTLNEATKNTNRVSFVASDIAHHNDILFATHQEVSAGLQRCLVPN